MRVGFVQWPDGLFTHSDLWSALADDVARSAPEILVTNEMPFGPWLAASPTFDNSRAQGSIRVHEDGLKALQALRVPIVISSRPVMAGARLANEAFILERGSYRFLHQKHFFPAEEGWFEAEWFRTARPGFELAEANGVRMGALLCTELMFNERARAYGRAGGHLIAVPRATGSSAQWKTAGAMAAIVSGCYVVSSNRVGASSGGPTFGGGGYAFAPDGSLLSESDEEHSIVVFELDTALADHQKSCYPAYVAEELLPSS